MPATNVEVTKTPNENPTNLIRRFTKKVQGSGILPRVRNNRYSSRTISKTVRHKQTMKRLARRAVYEELLRLGKIQQDFKKPRR